MPIEARAAKSSRDQTVTKHPSYCAVICGAVIDIGAGLVSPVFEQLPHRSKERKKHNQASPPRKCAYPQPRVHQESKDESMHEDANEKFFMDPWSGRLLVGVTSSLLFGFCEQMLAGSRNFDD